MSGCVCLLATVFLLGGLGAWAQDKAPGSSRKLPDGVYAVQRDGLNEKDVLPLKDGEVLAVDHHRYLKKDESEPPRFLVARSTPEVALDLAGEPKAVKEEAGGVRILLKLQPKGATALE